MSDTDNPGGAGAVSADEAGKSSLETPDEESIDGEKRDDGDTEDGP